MERENQTLHTNTYSYVKYSLVTSMEFAASMVNTTTSDFSVRFSFVPAIEIAYIVSYNNNAHWKLIQKL